MTELKFEFEIVQQASIKRQANGTLLCSETTRVNIASLIENVVEQNAAIFNLAWYTQGKGFTETTLRTSSKMNFKIQAHNVFLKAMNPFVCHADPLPRRQALF